MFRIAVLTISDRCSRNEREEQSGKVIIELIKGINGEIVQYDIVPDEIDLIREKLLFYCDDLKTDFEIYTRNVRNKTRKLKNKLFENWNGLDFYDNEPIIDNLNLKFYDKNYPTIDHKISIFCGFVNNINFEI